MNVKSIRVVVLITFFRYCTEKPLDCIYIFPDKWKWVLKHWRVERLEYSVVPRAEVREIGPGVSIYWYLIPHSTLCGAERNGWSSFGDRHLRHAYSLDLGYHKLRLDVASVLWEPQIPSSWMWTSNPNLPWRLWFGVGGNSCLGSIFSGVVSIYSPAKKTGRHRCRQAVSL